MLSVSAAVSAFFQFSVMAADPAKVEPVKIQVAADRRDALYKCGEKATFHGTVTMAGNPLTAGIVTVRISNDGMKTISTQEIDLAKNNPFKVEDTMGVPGFLQCEVKLDKDRGCAGAGFDPEKLKMSGYFDVVNFARSITCPIIFSVGFIDTTCSPSSVYAAYNTIFSPKMIFDEPAMGHDHSKRFTAYRDEWLKGKLGLSKEITPSL
jgi:hypothetical protein